MVFKKMSFRDSTEQLQGNDKSGISSKIIEVGI